MIAAQINNDINRLKNNLSTSAAKDSEKKEIERKTDQEQRNRTESTDSAITGATVKEHVAVL